MQALHRSLRVALLALLALSTAEGCGSEDDGTPGTGSPIPQGLDLTVDAGPIHGVALEGTRGFLGVPYAAPPVGALRFRPPAPVEPWSEPREVVSIGPGCPQTGTWVDSTSEDCLTLNVWTPEPAPTMPLPEMVWLHGGAFVVGGGGQVIYDGQRLVENGNVVVVTLNYRLGALGFLRHHALTAEDPEHPTSGMYGFEDQLAALQWVKTNIATFGGDPGRVTLFGESAGGVSTCLHLLSSRSAGLFQRAIIESGPCDLVELPDAAEADAEGLAVAEALGCTDATDVPACLRGFTPEELRAAVKAEEALPGGAFFGGSAAPIWWPHVDGLLLAKAPSDSLASGDLQDVPLLLGTMADEGRSLLSAALGSPPITSEEEYRDALARIFAPADVDAILAEYPVTDTVTPAEAANQVLGDAAFVCPTRRLARAAAAQGLPTFLYTFEGAPSSGLLAAYGPTHGVDPLFVFGNDWPGVASLGAAGLPLSEAVQGYWSRHAAAGDPNDASAPVWPAYEVASDAHVILSDPVASGAGLRKEECDFWDTIGTPHVPLLPIR